MANTSMEMKARAKAAVAIALALASFLPSPAPTPTPVDNKPKDGEVRDGWTWKEDLTSPKGGYWWRFKVVNNSPTEYPYHARIRYSSNIVGCTSANG